MLNSRAGPLRSGRFISALVGVLLLGSIGVGCAALGLGQLPAKPQRPSVPARAAYVAEDGHVYTVPLAGGDARRVSQIAGQVAGEPTAGYELPSGRWPAWAPDGSRVAFIRLLVGPSESLHVAQLWTAVPDGTTPQKVWEATDREPIYLAWSPDGAAIALLVQSSRDFELILVDARGVEPPRKLAQGSPFYFAWAADSRSLLLHVGDLNSGSSTPGLGVLRLGPPDEYRSLGIAPGRFRTPSWTADGRTIAFVADGPGGVPMLSLVSPQGGDITRLAAVGGQTAFAMTPDGARIAWSSRSETERLAYVGLEVASADGRTRTQVTEDLVVAFFWSPDADRLAFVTVNPSGTAFVWNVADADGANARRLGTFTPSSDQLRQLAFFDQYAISHGHWSPDGTALVYAVSPPGESRAPGAADPGTVMAVPVDGSTGPRTVVGGNVVALPVPAP